MLGLGSLLTKVAAAAVVPRIVKALSALGGPPEPIRAHPSQDSQEPVSAFAPELEKSLYGRKPVLRHTRAYDAANKRWISRDPLGEGVDTNLYRYCGNSPINLTDPSGLLPEWVEAIVETIAKPAKSVYEVFGPIESDLTKPAPPNPSPSGASGFLLRNTLRGIPGVMICPTKVGDGTLKGNGIKTVKDLIDTSKPGRATKGRATQYERTGGMDAANADFDSLGLSDVTTAPNGTRIGRLPDGRTVNVRGQSTAGTPTLEIQGTSSTLKFRYGP